MTERNKAEQERRRRLAEEVLENLSDSQIVSLAEMLAHAYLAGQTPQQAAADSVAYLENCGAIHGGCPTDADMRGEA